MINENDSAVLFQLTERWGIADYRKIAAEDLGMTGEGPFEYIWVLWNATPHINLYESFAVKSETDKFFGSCPLGSYLQTVSAHLRFGKLEGNWDQVENVERAEQDGERERETERDRERQRETERDRERQRETERDRERQRETERDREVLRDSEEIRLIDSSWCAWPWTGLKTTDWTQYIAPFWSAVIQSALQPRGWWALLRGQIHSALFLPLLTSNIFAGYVYWTNHVCSPGLQPYNRYEGSQMCFKVLWFLLVDFCWLRIGWSLPTSHYFAAVFESSRDSLWTWLVLQDLGLGYGNLIPFRLQCIQQ